MTEIKNGISHQGKEIFINQGAATNIGVQFFDMLGWIFDDFKGVELEIHKPKKQLESSTYKKPMKPSLASMNKIYHLRP